jgi:hypothetical protein
LGPRRIPKPIPLGILRKSGAKMGSSSVGLWCG